jgi:hypothetical protein
MIIDLRQFMKVDRVIGAGSRSLRQLNTATLDVFFGYRARASARTGCATAVCILNKATELVTGTATNLGESIKSITFGVCSAKVRKKTGQCRFKLYIHPNGMPAMPGLGHSLPMRIWGRVAHLAL